MCSGCKTCLDPVLLLSHAGSEKDAEYLVKWIGKAHIHNEWVPEPLLLRIAKRKVINFKRRYGSQPCTLTEPAWTQPCRFICRRPCLSGPGWEVLVKWCDLGYEHATWEVSLCPMHSSPGKLADHLHLESPHACCSAAGVRVCWPDRRLLLSSLQAPGVCGLLLVQPW